MKKIQIFCALLILGISACSDSIDNVVPESMAPQASLSYQDFIFTYLSSSNEESLKFFLANDKDKVNQSLKMINANNGTNYSEENLMPVEYLLNMNNLVKKERALLPNLEILDEKTLEIVQMDFPGLSLAQITPNEENLRKYYERKLEYAGFEKLSINQLVPFSEQPVTVQDLLDALAIAGKVLCPEENWLLVLHPLKAISILASIFETELIMEKWFGNGLLAALVFGSDIEQDVPANAVKHALWNYTIADNIQGLPWPIGNKSIGLHIAEEWTYAHEQCSGPNAANAMDLHNNKIGRDIFNEWDDLSESILKIRLFEKMHDALPACNTIESIQTKPNTRMVYTHYIDAAGAKQENNCNPMQVSITADRPYTGPGSYSWVSNVSGHTGSLTYKWSMNNIEIGTGPNLTTNISDSMFDIFGTATIWLEVRSSTHQRKSMYVGLFKGSGTGDELPGDPGPVN